MILHSKSVHDMESKGYCMTPFVYGAFYDVPRAIMLRYKGKSFFLHSRFDEEIDDYSEHYSVYEIPESANIDAQQGSWDFLKTTKMLAVGRVAVSSVLFDPTKRTYLDASFLDGPLKPLNGV